MYHLIAIETTYQHQHENWCRKAGRFDMGHYCNQLGRFHGERVFVGGWTIVAET